MSRTLTYCSHHLCSTSHLRHSLTRLIPVILALFISQNMSAFHIECPPDTSVACDSEIWDLSIFGTAYVFGYGEPVPAGDPISEEYYLNSCGSGTIVRTWVAYDYGNNPHYCSQTIYVGGGSGGVYINWPPDYIIHDCYPGGTDPEDLPPPYDKPVVDDSQSECSQIMMGYDDMVFDISPACTKILRKWTVIDWCQYDPNDWHPTGIWEHTQLIKIKPENPPTIWCPSDITVSADGTCNGTYVHVPPATGMSDCGADVIITNHSPYADSHGADASGYYPFGTTKVTFKASDGCGGETTCHMYVTIKDMKAPTPVCYYGISISLMQMDDGYYMDLRPEFFNKGSYDNCTAEEDLIFDIEPKRVDCSNIGETPVRVYVTDLDGNTAWCNTIVLVQDNNDICPPTNGIIQGAVFTPDGSMLQDIEVELGGADASDMTAEDGHYAFDHVPFGQSYEIEPSREVDNTDGITSMDLVVLLKHILGVEKIEDPYLYMAADLDGSGHVSVNDLLDLKEIVLKKHHELPTETTWKFVDAGYVFGNMNDPLAGTVPGSYTIGSFDQDMNDLNFIGVKVGDLTGDVNMPSGFADVVDVNRKPGKLMQASYSDEKVKAGETFEVTLSVEPGQDLIQALQFALSFDPEKAGFLEVSEYHLASLDPSHLALDRMEQGRFNGIWFDVEPLSAPSKLITLVFEAYEDVTTTELLGIQNKALQSIAYSPDGDSYKLEISSNVGQTQPAVISDELTVGTNYPNPFSGATIVPVRVKEAGQLHLSVFNGSGVEILSRRVEAVSGLNEITIEADEIREEGVLICRITSGENTRTIRMLSLKRE